MGSGGCLSVSAAGQVQHAAEGTAAERRLDFKSLRLLLWLRCRRRQSKTHNNATARRPTDICVPSKLLPNATKGLCAAPLAWHHPSTIQRTVFGVGRERRPLKPHHPIGRSGQGRTELSRHVRPGESRPGGYNSSNHNRATTGPHP
jgi:hypothetical protein